MPEMVATGKRIAIWLAEDEAAIVIKTNEDDDLQLSAHACAPDMRMYAQGMIDYLADRMNGEQNDSA